MRSSTPDSKSDVLGNERGAVLLITVFLLAVLIALAGLVVDLGHLFVVRSSIQNAADSAALAAADSLSLGPAEARNQAQLLAQLHLVHGAPVTLIPTDIELGTYDLEAKTFTALDPAQEADANSVRVTAQRSAARGNAIPLIFMPIFGKQASDVTAVSVAYFRPALCGGIFGDTQVRLSGNGSTDSYNSTLGPYSPFSANDNGDVCSNGPITLSGNAGVNGDAAPGPGESVSMSGNAYVTGSTDPAGSTTNLPAIDLGDVATNNDNGIIPYSLHLSGNNQLTLTGGRYYFTQLKITGNARITVAGDTIIYCAGQLQVSGNGFLNQSQNPPDLSILVTSSQQVKFTGNADFYGALYAPNAEIKVSGNGDVFGALIGDEIKITGNGDTHYDEALDKVSVLNDMELPIAESSAVLVQ